MARLSWPIEDNGETSTLGAKPKTGRKQKKAPEPEAQPSTTTKRRGRPRKDAGEAEAVEEELGTTRRSPRGNGKGQPESAAITAKGKKKGKSKTGRDVQPEPEPVPVPDNSRKSKKRAREAEAEAEQSRKSSKRSRSSIPSSSTQPTTSKTSKGPRGRRKKSSTDKAAPEPEPETTEPEPPSQQPKQRKRKSLQALAGATNTAEESDDELAPPFRHLESRTRHINRSMIEEKWSPLDGPSISNISALLSSVARPVLLRLNNMQKHTQASAVLNVVGTRLRNKLSRGMPFPPAATLPKREDELEFEKTIAGYEALEYQLDPLLHSVQLLQREKERMEKELEREYKVLNSLGANARTAARERREQVRKMHGLVLGVKGSEGSVRDEDEGRLMNGENMQVLKVGGDGGESPFAELDGKQDKELAGLATQIANHMDSLRGNLRQIDGVVPAIEQSQAALRARLLEHFDSTVVDNVVLG